MHYPEGSFGQIDSTKVRFYFYPQSTVIREITTDFLINEGLFGLPFILPANQITQITGSFGPTTQDYSFMSVFPHMHLLGKDLQCMAVTPTNDTINLIRINNWDFEWQGFYFFQTFIKIPAGSMIYAKGNYDNTVSATNPNPVTVQSGLNTEDEMFIFIFQFLVIVAAGFLTWFWVLSIYPASSMASFSFFAPIFGVMFGWIILKEEIGISIIISLLLVSVGIYLINVSD